MSTLLKPKSDHAHLHAHDTISARLRLAINGNTNLVNGIVDRGPLTTRDTESKESIQIILIILLGGSLPGSLQYCAIGYSTVLYQYLVP
eukprot:scaffold176511_cov65-Attheya_sp.AAC.2